MTTIREILLRQTDQTKFYFVIFDGTSAWVCGYDDLPEHDQHFEVLGQFLTLDRAFAHAEKENEFINK